MDLLESKRNLLASKWRAGGDELNRALYAIGDDKDTFIGLVDTSEIAQAIVDEHNLLQRQEFASFSLVDLARKSDQAEFELRECRSRLSRAEDFVQWILAMDDPDNAEGRIARQRLNVEWIIEKAREVNIG